MVEVTNELMFEVLKSLQNDLGGLKDDMRDVKEELRAVRGHMLATQQDIANIYSILARHDGRLDRIERRLELAEVH
jgi:DNA anti-recombination protein RmuC